MVFKRLNTPFVETPLGKAKADYDKAKGFRFFNQFHSVVILLVYEILIAISWDPDVMNYNAVDVWFIFANSFIMYGTLPFSLYFIFRFGRSMYQDWFGIKNKQERKKDKETKAKKEKEGKKDWKPEAKKPYRPNTWYLLAFTLGEALFWAFAIFALLKWVVFGLLLVPFEEIHVGVALDTVRSLKHFSSSPVQDLALAFGAGYYEEFVFRGLLFMFLVWLSGKNKRFANFKISLKAVDGVPLKYPEFKRKESNFVTAMIFAILIYALSHYLLPFADEANAYTFLYRCCFGFAMYLIFVYRGWAVLIWAHTLYDLLYFLFV
ncbi:MAG: CPBP family glutamic-type intramembrane protease [Bacteroidia bacterium]|nr:CPBP family glutamic-type intramembrane protease [Bacteroidia bacterium]